MFRLLALGALASLTLTSDAGAEAKLSPADKAVAAVRAKPTFAAAAASLASALALDVSVRLARATRTSGRNIGAGLHASISCHFSRSHRVSPVMTAGSCRNTAIVPANSPGRAVRRRAVWLSLRP